MAPPPHGGGIGWLRSNAESLLFGVTTTFSFSHMQCVNIEVLDVILGALESDHPHHHSKTARGVPQAVFKRTLSDTPEPTEQKDNGHERRLQRTRKNRNPRTTQNPILIDLTRKTSTGM